LELATVSIPFVDDPSVVFRVAWFTVASQPGVYLDEYVEAEGQTSDGMASFSFQNNGDSITVRISIQAAESALTLEASGPSAEYLTPYLDSLGESINQSLDKYRVLATADKSKVRRALVAKTSWDQLIRLIFDKRPLSEIYYQVAHGREMMIKATEGEDVHPITLSTSGWLAKIEPLPKDEALSGEVATALAKKSIEWKHDTQGILGKYI
jgi:hypothetical protein